jgi:hypothetical protein
MPAYRGKVMRRVASLLIGGPLLLALGGCPDADENTLVVFGPDSAVVLAPLAAPAFLLPPGGQTTFNILQPLGVDTTQSDVFGRSYAGPYGIGEFEEDPIYDFPGWNMWDTGRNKNDDPRLPALTGSTGNERLGDNQCSAWGPGFGGGTDIYDTWCTLEGMEPETDFTLIFVRYATRIRGELDAVEMILTGAVTDPDTLIPLGGAPAGFPTTYCNFSVLEPHPGPTTNPLVLGYATSGADSSLTFDCLIAGTGVWWGSTDGPPPPGAADSAIFAPNIQQSFDLPFYNYAVAVVGQGDAVNPVPTGAHAYRWQIGPDILEDGTPINNGLAPFPLRGDPSTVEPFQAQPDSVFVVLENMRPLAGGAVYKAWFFGGDNPPSEAVGEYTRVDPETDAILEGPTSTSSFAGGPGEIQHNIDFPPAAEGRTHIFYTVESSAGASSPSTMQPLWALQFQQPGPKTATQIFDFGTFADNTSSQRLWKISGTGGGGLFGVEFRQSYNHLPRPPVGYKYVGWLSSGDTLFLMLPDESFTSPPPEYAPLTDADIDMAVSPAGWVQPLEILSAMTRICTTASSPAAAPQCQGPYDLALYSKFLLNLEPKAFDPTVPGPTTVLEGVVPTPSTIGE